MSDIRFYAACLASYNNGVLHGRWIEASSDIDAMQEEINAMLRESRFPNVMVKCPETGEDVPSAEEYAIHDSEGLPRSFGEYAGLNAIAEYMEFVEKCESDLDLTHEQMAAIWNERGDYDSAISFIDDFAGVYDSWRNYTDEQADEAIAAYSSGEGIPQFLINYFDYDAFAHDLKHETNYIECDGVYLISYAN